MSLRIRLESLPETVGEFEVASEEKFYQGQSLIIAGYHDIGIYILGYVAEMMLKMAYYRVIGKTKPSFRVDSALTPAKNVGEALIPLIEPEMFHSLRFWAMLLQSVRVGQGRPLSAALALPFESRTERLYNNWYIGMRYRRHLATQAEAMQVLDDVAWLRTHLSGFWR